MDKIVTSKHKTLREINNTLLDFENCNQFASSSTPIVDSSSKRKRKRKAIDDTSNTESDTSRMGRISRHFLVDEDITPMEPSSKRKRKHKEIDVNTSLVESDEKINSGREELNHNITLDSISPEDAVDNSIRVSTSVARKSISVKRKKLNKRRLINSLTNQQITSSKSFKNKIARKKQLAAFKEIQKLPDYHTISKILTEPEKDTLKRKSHSHLPYPNQPTTIFWNTYSYLAVQIEKCLFQNDWNNLTKLLILMTAAPKEYKKFILKASLINFLCNPASRHNELIRDFLKECLSCQTEEDINRLLTSYFHIQNVNAVQENDDE